MSIIRTASSLTLFCLAATAVAACTSTQDDSVAGDNQALSACDMSGTWAIKVETPVTWGGSFVVQAGEGVVTNWLRTTRTQTGTEIVDDAAICGVETPDYTSTAVFQSEHDLHGPQVLHLDFRAVAAAPLLQLGLQRAVLRTGQDGQ